MGEAPDLMAALLASVREAKERRQARVLLCETDSRACTCRAPADTPSGMHHDNCPTNPASRRKGTSDD